MTNHVPITTRYGRTPLTDEELANKKYVDDNIASTVLTTKADILSRDSTALLRLAVGSNDEVLTADSAQASGLKWAAVSGETNTASNVGTGAGDVFKQKVGVDLELKTLLAADGNIVITNNTSDITIDALGVGLEIDSVESSTTPITESAEGSASGSKRYTPFVLPTAFEMYVITAVEVDIGTVTGDKVIVGVDQIDADPPVEAWSRQIATSKPTLTGTVDTKQKISMEYSNLVRGGTQCAGWLNADGATTLFGRASVASINRARTVAYAVTANFECDQSAFAASANNYYCKIFYKGVGKAI